MEPSIEHDALMGALLMLVIELSHQGFKHEAFMTRLRAAAQMMEASGKPEAGQLMLKNWESAMTGFGLATMDTSAPQ